MKFRRTKRSRKSVSAAVSSSIADGTVHIGSDNVFADLGLSNAPERLGKARLADQILSIIELEGLTQTQAAKLLGVDQPKISQLRRGRLEDFSTDRLLRFLMALGQDIEIVVRTRPLRAGKDHSSFRVTSSLKAPRSTSPQTRRTTRSSP